jgi:hypothetical protein
MKTRNTDLQTQNTNYESELKEKKEKAEKLEGLNNILINTNSEHVRRDKEITFQSFLQFVETNIIRIVDYPTISVFIRWDSGYRTHYTTRITCVALDGFIKTSIPANCWRNIIKDLKLYIDQHSLGDKVEILPDNITIERVFMNAIEFIENWEKLDLIPKGYTDELRTKVQNYIYFNQFRLKEPLNFNIAKMNMKLSDANKEIRRLSPILRRDVYTREDRFNILSIPEIESSRLVKHLRYMHQQ